MTEYRRASREDYAAIIEMANHAFAPKEHSGDFEKDTSVNSYFPRILPKLYQNPDTAPMHYIAVLDGKITGIVASFIQPTYVSGHRMNVVGIGTVCTHPDHRREGLMIRLMEDSIRFAEESGADYMVLGGQRQRYGHWGFENAGTNTIFFVSTENTGRLFGPDADFGYAFHEFREEDTEYIREERALRTSAGIYEERPGELEFRALFSMGHKPYAILKDGKFEGSFLSADDRIEDLRLKNPDAAPQDWR